MELNAEKVKKALEIHTGILDMPCEECPYNCDAHDEICLDVLAADILALINSQEQDKEKLGLLIDEIVKEKRELFEENKRLTAENEKLDRLANLRQRDLDNANDLLFKVEDENERLKEFAEYIKTAPIVKIDEEVISEFAIKRAIRNYELHFGKSAQLDQIAKEMLEGDNED